MFEIVSRMGHVDGYFKFWNGAGGILDPTEDISITNNTNLTHSISKRL